MVIKAFHCAHVNAWSNPRKQRQIFGLVKLRITFDDGDYFKSAFLQHPIHFRKAHAQKTRRRLAASLVGVVGFDCNPPASPSGAEKMNG